MAGNARRNFSIFGEEADDVESKGTHTEGENVISSFLGSQSNLSVLNVYKAEENNRQSLRQESSNSIASDGEDDEDDASFDNTEVPSETYPETHLAFIKAVKPLHDNEKKQETHLAKNIMKNLSSVESSDLTRQLFTQYLEFGSKRFVPRNEWDNLDSLDRIKGSNFYGSWPLEPHNVPRPNHEVWPDSLTSNVVWTPSSDLEEAIFSVMLKRARSQWNQKLEESELRDGEYPDVHPGLVDPTDLDIEVQEYPRLTLPTDEEVLAAQPDQSTVLTAKEIVGQKRRILAEKRMTQLQQSQEMLPKWTKLKRKAVEPDDSVISADDERSFKLLKPSIRSVISSIDKLLYGLHQSSHRPTTKSLKKSSADELPVSIDNGSKDDDVESGVKRVHPHTLTHSRDWSNVLGIAGFVGIPSDVLSRTAVRCAALFDEGMEFVNLEENVSELPRKVVINPTDFTNPSARDKLAIDKPSVWTEEQGCPFPHCSWYGLKDVRRRKGIVVHMMKKHNWDQTHGGPELESLIKGKVGAVHTDGFIQHIPRVWKKHRREEKPQTTEGDLEGKIRTMSSEDEGQESTT